jgi:hypothetical protein
MYARRCVWHGVFCVITCGLRPLFVVASLSSGATYVAVVSFFAALVVAPFMSGPGVSFMFRCCGVLFYDCVVTVVAQVTLCGAVAWYG